jgi:hypothetical protein
MMPLVRPWPNMMLLNSAPFTCAAFTLPVILPLPRPTATGNWFCPYSIFVSKDTSRPIS